MLVTLGNVQAIFRGYSTRFWEAYSGSAAPMSASLLMTVPTTGISEQHNWLSSTRGIRELVDEAQIQGLLAQDYTITNKEYEETLELKELEIKTDKYGLLGPRLQILGSNSRGFDDELLANLIVKGLDGTGLDYTGSAFFGTGKKAHADAVAFTNVTTGKLTAARYQAGRANLKNRRNPSGRPMNLGLDLRLIVSPTWEAKGREILVAEIVNNTTNVDRGTAKLEVWPWLTAVGLEDAWFLADFGNPLKPFIKQQLVDWTYYSVDNPQSEYVLRFHKFLWQIYSAMAIGFGFPESIYGSDGSVA